MRGRIRTKLAAIGLAVAATATLATAVTAATPAAAAAPAIIVEPTATATPYCRVSFTIVNQWPGGEIVAIVVTNISSVPVRWRLVLRFPGSNPNPIVQVWNANYVQSGSVATIVPIPPSDVLQPGQSVAIGQLILIGGTIVLPIGEVTCTPV
jgi:cellulase/cellobiase CelA1